MGRLTAFALIAALAVGSSPKAGTPWAVFIITPRVFPSSKSHYGADQGWNAARQRDQSLSRSEWSGRVVFDEISRFIRVSSFVSERFEHNLVRQKAKHPTSSSGGNKVPAQARFNRTPLNSKEHGAPQTETTIFVGGPILTIDDKQPAVEAMAVRPGKIISLGGRASGLPDQSARNPMIQLPACTLMPA